MKFTLFNLLIVNAVVATSLSLLLGDESRIQRNAAIRENHMKFIVRSAVWQQLPARHAANQRLDRSILYHCE